MISDPPGRSTPERLTDALDELDVIRGQLREARGAGRTSRFYRLERLRPAISEVGSHAADVIELSGGWVLVHWIHDPKAVSMYSSINSARVAFAGAFQLILDDVSERRPESTTVVSALDLPSNLGLGISDRVLLRLVRVGLANKQIALRLNLADSTIKNRLSMVYKKLGVDDRLGAILLTRDWNLEEGPQSVDY